MRDPRRGGPARPSGASGRPRSGRPGGGLRRRLRVGRTPPERPPAPPPRSGDPDGRRASLTGRAAVLALVLGMLAVSFAYPLRAWWDQRSRMEALRAERAALSVSVERLEAAKQRWNDPAHVRAQARARLGFVLPGEEGYVVLDDSDLLGGVQVDPGLAPVAEEGPWWARLWDSVEAADKAAGRAGGAEAEPGGGR